MKRHRANVHFKGSISAAESATRKIVAPPIPKTLRKSSKKKREESASSSETENDEEIVEEIVQVINQMSCRQIQKDWSFYN